MPSRGFKCTAEITLEIVSSPGTWLPNRDDLYVTIEFFNQVKRTRLLDPVFPLCIHERFRFEKYFWPASDPQDVVEMLEDMPLTVELRQVTDVYLGGCLLAYIDANGRDFLYPVASSRPACASGREAMLTRTIDFAGVSPKLEFSTYSVVEELRDGEVRRGEFLGEATRPSRRGGGSRGFQRQTLSAALRTRSPSPPLALAEESSPSRRRRRRQQQQQQHFEQPQQEPKVDNRPPFVVRHLDKNILARQPKLHDTFTRLGRGPPPKEAPASPPEQQRQRRRRRSAALRRSRSTTDMRRWRDDDEVEFDDKFDGGAGYAEYRMQPPIPVPAAVGRSPLSSRYNPRLSSTIRHRVADTLRSSGAGQQRLYGGQLPMDADLLRLEEEMRMARMRDTVAY